MKSKLLILFILAILAIGCVTEFTAKLPANEEQILIVDGNIIGDSVATFYLGKSVPLDSVLNTQRNFISDAKITIIGDNGYQSSPATYSGNSMYSMKVGTLDDNVSYSIKVEYNGDIYQSTPAKPLHTPDIDSVSWIQPDSAGIVSFRVSTHDTDTKEAKFYMWNYTEDWEITAYYPTTAFFNPDKSSSHPIDDSSCYYQTDPPPYYYCWKKNVSNQYLIGSTESLKENRIVNKQLYQRESGNDRFWNLYSVNVNQKAISKGAYDYYQNKITLNEGMGGLFTPQPSEVIGNIICTTNPLKKVMGYIEFSKNTTPKRIFVYPYQMTHQYLYSSCDEITPDSVKTILSTNKITLRDFYISGFRPAGDLDFGGLPTNWARVYCTDCVANGGSKNKPDFWTNNHQ